MKVLSTLVFYFVKESKIKKKFGINLSDWAKDMNKAMS